MIVDHRLHDRQSKPGAVFLARVIRGKQAAALFRRKALACVRDFDPHIRAFTLCAQNQTAALRHSVHRIKDQVRKRAM